MATDPQTLLSAANCYTCQLPGEWQLMKLSLLRQILLQLSPMADTSPQALLSQANCYNCYGPGLWPLLELALLSQIVNQGMGGGSSQIVAYTGANPNSDGVKPPNLNAPAIAVKPNGTTYTWSIADQMWE